VFTIEVIEVIDYIEFIKQYFALGDNIFYFGWDSCCCGSLLMYIKIYYKFKEIEVPLRLT